MSWFGKHGGAGEESAEARARKRREAWEAALSRNKLPDFVDERLKAAGERKAPWLSTMTPAELLLTKSHGLRPLATVSGTCWFHYGQSWTQGHADGWKNAVWRMRLEALAVGANAVVDVQMRTVKSPLAHSMDFTVFGTAVRIDGLPPSRDPVVATVSAMEFARLVEMGIVVCGIAVGADYDYLSGHAWNAYDGLFSNGPNAIVQQQLNTMSGYNRPVMELTDFWERVRRRAHAQLRNNAAALGNGVLAKTHFGQLLRVERDKQPPDYLGRHIVIGTIVDTQRGDGVPHHIETVVDMRDDLSPLDGTRRGNELESNNEHVGGI